MAIWGKGPDVTIQDKHAKLTAKFNTGVCFCNLSGQMLDY
jgi:hypothetical protein